MTVEVAGVSMLCLDAYRTDLAYRQTDLASRNTVKLYINLLTRQSAEAAGAPLLTASLSISNLPSTFFFFLSKQVFANATTLDIAVCQCCSITVILQYRLALHTTIMLMQLYSPLSKIYEGCTTPTPEITSEHGNILLPIIHCVMYIYAP